MALPVVRKYPCPCPRATCHVGAAVGVQACGHVIAWACGHTPVCRRFALTHHGVQASMAVHHLCHTGAHRCQVTPPQQETQRLNSPQESVIVGPVQLADGVHLVENVPAQYEKSEAQWGKMLELPSAAIGMLRLR